MKIQWGAGAEGYDEEAVVGEGGGEGCVIIVVNLDDGEVGVGGERAGAGMSGQGGDLVFVRTKEVGEDVGADLSGALMVLVGWMEDGMWRGVRR